MTGVQTSASLFRRTANDIGIQLQVTVLIPAYNEEQAIIRVLEEVSAVMGTQIKGRGGGGLEASLAL